MKIFLAVLLMTLVLPTVVDARRTHVRINKPYTVERPTQPIAVPIAIIPPLAIFYDLQRRTGCEGDVLGLGGPGFTEPMPVGNVMIPAVNRSACAAAPKRY